MDWRETHSSREGTQRSRERMLWLAVIYASVQLIIFPGLIEHKDSFSSMPCPGLSAGSMEKVPAWYLAGTPLPQTQAPDDHHYPKPGEAGVQAKAGKLKSMESRAGGQTHPSPQGANRWGRERWDPADPPRASAQSAATTAKFT